MQARPTTPADCGRLSAFLQNAFYRHQHLDWVDALAHIGQTTFWLLEDHQSVLAALDCTPTPPSIAWVRLFHTNVAPQLAWSSLFPSILEAIIHSHPQAQQIAAVSLFHWFSDLLCDHGFLLHQKIVMLERSHQPLPQSPTCPGIQIRTVLPQDIPALARIDEETFEPLWINSLESIQQACLQSGYATIAEKAGQIVGFQITSIHTLNAHLGRLAVAPNCQGQGIGKTLVLDMLQHCQNLGVPTISVNTQNTNLQSLQLYESVGFLRTGSTFPVYTRKIKP